MKTFQVERDVGWRLPLLLIGATESRSIAVLEDELVDLRFGIARVRIPYENIRAVHRRDWAWWLGVGIRIAADKTLGLIGSTRSVVQIALKAPTVEGVLFMRHPRNIAVSIRETDAFIAALESRIHAR